MTVAALSPASVHCSGCGAPLPGRMLNPGAESRCDGCGSILLAEVFPAFFRQLATVSNGEALSVPGEASCFYHPQKKAASLCSVCGGFLCTLCETELAGKRLCPTCIDKGRINEQIEQLVNQRTLYDGLALSMALLPIVLFLPATIFTAPVALYIALRNWKKPGSILPRTRVRFVLAIIIAFAQIAAWSAVLVGLAS